MFVALAPAAALAGGNTNFTIGVRELGGDWGLLGTQPMFGVTVDWGMDDWPVHLAWGLNVSAWREERPYGRKGDLTAMYAEVSFGLRWSPNKYEHLRPYLGAGIASVSATLNHFDYTATDFGLYANAGLSWRIGSSFNLGVDLRYCGGAEYDDFYIPSEYSPIGPPTTDASYFAYSLLLGFGWGK